jgi:hypothetical protein
MCYLFKLIKLKCLIIMILFINVSKCKLKIFKINNTYIIFNLDSGNVSDITHFFKLIFLVVRYLLKNNIESGYILLLLFLIFYYVF